ncbi:MAG: hypothetical protein JWM72_2137 [Actinomycetia bacterium]|nr:hypothetical protein [Actinomycetes bacterium]
MKRAGGARLGVLGVVVGLVLGGTALVPASISPLPKTAAAATSTVTRDRIAKAFGVGTVSTPAIPNSVSEVAVAFVSLDDVVAGQTAVVSGGGLAWHLAGRTNAQRGDAEIWWAKTVGAAFTATVSPAQSGRSSQLTVMTFTGSAGIGSVVGASAAKGAPTLSLSPVAGGSWIGAVGMDFDSATPRTIGGRQTLDAQSVDGLGDTYWVQHLDATSTAGQVVTVNDTAPATDRFDFEGIEVTGPRVASPGVVLDPSTPAPAPVANNAAWVVSPSFSPPPNTVLYAVFSMDSLPTSNSFVAGVYNSGTQLTWHQTNLENHTNGTTVGGYVHVFWAYNPGARTNMTVAGGFNSRTKNVVPPVGLLQVLVVDHAQANQATAASRIGWNVAGTSAPSVTVTTTAPNSLVVAVFDNWDSSTTPTVPAGQVVTSIVQNNADRDAYWLQARTAPTAAPGPVTMNATAPSDIHWHEIAWEILAA